MAEALAAWPKKGITLDDLQKLSGVLEYDELCAAVRQCVESGILSAVKSSRTNGRRDPLFIKYRIHRPPPSKFQDKVRFLHPTLLKNGWLLSHADEYPKWRRELEALDDFFCRSDSYRTAISKKERAYQLFGEEKHLENREEFTAFFHRLGLSSADLNCYETPEPLFDYISDPSPDMTLLICENKDIWYNLRRVMLEERKKILFGLPLDGVILGEGNKITGEKKLEDYLRGLGMRSAEFWYWGDIDKEGFDIFLRLKRRNPGRTIRLFSRGYEEMIRFAKQGPPQKDQSRDRDYDFDEIYRAFSGETLRQVRNLLEAGRRIPQETINYEVLKENMK